MTHLRLASFVILVVALAVFGAACGSDDESAPTVTPLATPGTPSSDLPGVIAFSSDRGSGYDIYTVSASDGSEKQITSDGGDDREPAWSPDGTRMAYQSNSGGAPNIFFMNADGSEKSPFRPGPEVQGGVKWSPDGAQIAYYSFLAAEVGYLWIADVPGPDFFPLLRAIHPSAADTHCAGGFSGDWVDGDTVLFRGAWAEGKALELCTVNTDESRITPIFSERDVFAFYPDLSPDGQTIVFSYQPQGQSDEDLYMVSIEGRNRQPLLATTEGEGYPTWSPDGEWVAFVSARDGDAEIYAIRKDGTDLRQLTNNDYADLEPAWAEVTP